MVADSKPASTLPRPALDEAALRRQLLTPDRLWTGLTVVTETGSTNADLAVAAGAGVSEGLIRVAEYQRSGRGRAGRPWSSPPRAGLAVSVLLRPGDRTGRWPAAPGSRWGWLPLLAGVSLAAAVTGRTGLPAQLKWPNDLLVGGGKCAGILAEVVAGAVVVGIGLNVDLRPDELPPAPESPGVPPGPPAALPATSLALAGATALDRTSLLVELLAQLEHWYGRWRVMAGDPDRTGLRPAYQRACATLGQPVRVRLPGGDELTGVADTVDHDGRLVLASAGGPRALAAGDVHHLRIAPPPT